MLRLSIALVAWQVLLGSAGAASADPDELNAPGPMTALSSTDPCPDLQATGDATAGKTTCVKLATLRLQAGTRASLFRVQDAARHPLWTSYYVVVVANGMSWRSEPLFVGPQSKLGGQYSEPVDQDPRLRLISVQDAPAVALELRVRNRANITDPAMGRTVGFRDWKFSGFVVCANRDGWSCVDAGFGAWLDLPCTASLDEHGVLTHRCEQQDVLRFGP